MPPNRPLDLGSSAVRDLPVPVFLKLGVSWLGLAEVAEELGVSILPGDPDSQALSFWGELSEAEQRMTYDPRVKSDSAEPWSWTSSVEVEEVK